MPWLSCCRGGESVGQPQPLGLERILRAGRPRIPMFWQHGQLYFLMLATRKKDASHKSCIAQNSSHSSYSCTDARADISYRIAAARTRAAIAGHHEAVPLPLLLWQQLAPTNSARARNSSRSGATPASAVCGWHYWRCSGQLTDPATGVVIARLEGVAEATRALRGDARRGDSEDDVNDDDFLVEPRAFEVRRRYAYADENDELIEWRARPDAPPRAL